MAKTFKNLGKDIGKQLSDKIRREVKQTWWKRLGSGNVLVNLVREIIQKGIIPVRGFGSRFVKYSDTYIKQINGELKFFTNKSTGGVFPVLPPGKVKKDKASGAEFTPLGKGGKAQRVKFEKGLGVGKKRSPVSMTLSGDMMKSLNFNPSRGVLGFKDEKAAWHNDGQGKLPERRLLPDREGERFNQRIEKRLKDELSEAINKEKTSIKNILRIDIKFK